jgi:hypothetical protein
MAYTFTDPLAGLPAIGGVYATALVPGGTIRRAVDPNYGEGEFIFLQGVATTAVGNFVTWSGVSGANAPTFQTALLPNTANQGVPVAVATAAIGAGQWGWYQIGGVGIGLTGGTFAAAGPVYFAAAGVVTSVATASKQIVNAYGLTAVGVPAANQILVSLNRPFAQGAIT